MKLELDIIKTITKGVLEIKFDGEFYTFERFTPHQKEIYKRNADFLMKTKATSGIRFDFITSSKTLHFDYVAFKASSRNFCYFDVYESDVLVNHVGYEQLNEKPHSFDVAFGEGEKRVTVYFPCLCGVKLKNVIVDDNATITTVENKKSAIFYGDSITQGYDSFFPSLVYAARVSRKLDLDFVNQGVGAEIFDHETLDENINYSPDFVFSAYGTNDWSWGKEDIYTESEKYFEKLSSIHPASQRYAITPIHRLDNVCEKKKIGTFFETCEKISEIALKYNNIIIQGTKISIPSSKAFSDNWLHPNEIGYELMAEGIIKIFKD